MKHRHDTRGFLYFMIAVLTVWSGELANLGGAELYQRIHRSESSIVAVA